MKEWTPENEALDDLEEMAEDVGWMTPINYARLRGIRPQRVYRLIRTGGLEAKRCDCGRKIIMVSAADAKLQAGQDLLQATESATVSESEGPTL